MKRLACIVALALAAGVATAAGGQAEPTPAPVPPVREVVPRAKFVRAVEVMRRAEKRVRVLERTIRTGPDFDVSIRLAAIAYGQDWRHLKACALSEGGREGERFARFNARPNAAGSGATGLFQFMRGTFLGTPFAAMDWHRQDVQAHAAAWMWAQSRRGEWTGADC